MGREGWWRKNEGRGCRGRQQFVIGGEPSAVLISKRLHYKFMSCPDRLYLGNHGDIYHIFSSQFLINDGEAVISLCNMQVKCKEQVSHEDFYSAQCWSLQTEEWIFQFNQRQNRLFYQRQSKSFYMLPSFF